MLSHWLGGTGGPGPRSVLVVVVLIVVIVVIVVVVVLILWLLCHIPCNLFHHHASLVLADVSLPRLGQSILKSVLAAVPFIVD